MANRGAIRGLALRTLQRNGVSTTETGDFDTWIDEVIREELCLVTDWPGMWTVDTITTVAGTQEYTFGAGSPGFTATRFKECDLIQCRSSSTDEWTDLKETDLRALLLNYSEQSTARARPDGEWALSDNDSFKVRPIPDAAYSLRTQCVIYPAAFTAGSGGDSETNFFTLNYAGLLVERVAVRAAISLGRLEEVAAIDASSSKKLGAIKGAERMKTARRRPHMALSVAAGRIASSASRGRRVRDGYGWWP